MEALYLFTGSQFTNRMAFDWALSLGLSCLTGIVITYIPGVDSFAYAQYMYLIRYGSGMITPVFRMVKDGPLVDEMEDLKLAWTRYGVFAVSVKATFYFGSAWTFVKGLPLYYLVLLTVVLAVMIPWLVGNPTARIGQTYVAYRVLNARLDRFRWKILRHIWLGISATFAICREPGTRFFHRLRIGLGILPAPEQQTKTRPFIYDKMVTPTEIRLLYLDPSPLSRVVRCSIEHFPIDEAPPFEAISYTWGDNAKTHQVLIDGQPFGVTHNAHAALHHRSFYAMATWVWIDSICINQEDLKEKSKQITMMAKIYKQAARVIVFLGDRPDSHMVKDVLDELSRRKKWYDEYKLGEKLFQEYLRQETSPRWQALLNLLEQPWFERIWVLQEVAVAGTVHAVYGISYIDWDTLVSVLRIFLDARAVDTRALLQSTSDNMKSRKISNAPTFASIMTSTKSLLEQGEKIHLSGLLFATHGMSATDPRDKVYALLGISDPKTHGPLVVDYTQDVSALYKQTAQHMVAEGYVILLLHKAGIGYRKKLLDLPSWVADWSCFQANDMFADMNYKAATGIRHRVKAEPHSDHIHVVGKVLSTIQHLSSEMKDIPNEEGVFEGGKSIGRLYNWYLEVKELVGNHILEPYLTGQPKEEALWRTLIGDTAQDSRPAPAVYQDYFRLWCTVIAAIDTVIQCAKDGKIPFGINSEQEYTDMMLQHIKYNALCGAFTANRRFGLTDQGYMGMVPPGTEIGDTVCILYEAGTPFVLREVAELNAGTLKRYQLVGDCYMHGMMDGEMMDLKEIKAQWITVI